MPILSDLMFVSVHQIVMYGTGWNDVGVRFRRSGFTSLQRASSSRFRETFAPSDQPVSKHGKREYHLRARA
jgi:hypothetical protein